MPKSEFLAKYNALLENEIKSKNVNYSITQQKITDITNNLLLKMNLVKMQIILGNKTYLEKINLHMKKIKVKNKKLTTMQTDQKNLLNKKKKTTIFLIVRLYFKKALADKKKKTNQGGMFNENLTEKNMNLPKKANKSNTNKINNYATKFSLLKDKEKNNALDSQQNNRDSGKRRSRNGNSDTKDSLILPSNTVDNINLIVNNIENSHKPTKGKGNSGRTPIILIEDILIYPINNQKVVNNVTFGVNSLNEKVDKLIGTLKLDSTNKNLKQSKQKTKKTVTKKLNTSVENTRPLKIDDYFSNIVGDIKKNSKVIKGITEKIKKPEPKRNILKEEALIKINSDNQISKKSWKKYEILNNKIIEKAERTIFDKPAEKSLFHKANKNKKKTFKQKNFNQILESISSSHFADEKDFYFEIDSNNCLNNKAASLNQKGIIITNNYPKDTKGKRQTQVFQETQYYKQNDDDFFDWDYSKIIILN